MANVAVYGGSFNPVHLGHLMVPTHLLLNDPSVDRIIVMVCFQQAGKKLEPFANRLEMCRTAFAHLPRVEVSDLEGHLGGESFTLRTMQQLKHDHPDWNLRFVMGADLLEKTHQWGPDWAEIEKISPPLPIGRAGISPTRPDQPTPISPVVSSTIVREALRDRNFREAERYLPRSVLEHILANNLYGPEKEPERTPFCKKCRWTTSYKTYGSITTLFCDNIGCGASQETASK